MIKCANPSSADEYFVKARLSPDNQDEMTVGHEGIGPPADPLLRAPLHIAHSQLYRTIKKITGSEYIL